jgi:hypothetical protein
MKKMTIALSAVAGLAAATVAMASPAAAMRSAPVSAGYTVLALQASPVEVNLGQVGAAHLRQQCIVIDPAAAGTSHEADRDPARQVVPTFCP